MLADDARASSDQPTPDRDRNDQADRPTHVNGRRRRAASKSTLTNGNHQQADQADQANRPQLFSVRASELATIKPVWLWEARLRISTVAIVQGDTGVGKSSMLRALAADVTGGPPLTRKSRRKRPLGDVLWYAGEEQLEVTVRPGLLAAGADLTRIHCADVWRGEGTGRLELPADRERLEETIRRTGAVMTVLDPVFNFADGSCDLDGPTLPARRFMAALAGVAERTGCLIILTRNLTKDRSKGALNAGRGSGELGNAARSVLHLERYPGKPGLFALAVAKVNDAPIPSTLTYTLEAVQGGIRLTLQGQEDLSADDLAGGEDEALERSQLEKAVALIRQVLKDGEVESKVVKQKAADDVISERTLIRAAKLLGVRHHRQGSRQEAKTLWRLSGGK